MDKLKWNCSSALLLTHTLQKKWNNFICNQWLSFSSLIFHKWTYFFSYHQYLPAKRFYCSKFFSAVRSFCWKITSKQCFLLNNVKYWPFPSVGTNDAYLTVNGVFCDFSDHHHLLLQKGSLWIDMSPSRKTFCAWSQIQFFEFGLDNETSFLSFTIER